MITIKMLPRSVKFNPKDKRCEEPVSMTTVHLGRGRNQKLKAKCAYFAKIELNGRAMCLRHAQQEALNILFQISYFKHVIPINEPREREP